MTESLNAAMMDLAETLVGPIQAAAFGYRAQLMEEGTPPDIANEMMRDMHHLLCRAVGGELKDPEEEDDDGTPRSEA